MRRRSLLCVPVGLLLLVLPGTVVAQSPAPVASPVASTAADAAAVSLLAESIAATRHADTMHIALTGTGDMAGMDGPASLDGASMEADLDVADRALAVTLEVPSFDMSAIELRILGDQAYLKAAGMTEDGKWMATDAAMLVDLIASMIPGGRRIVNGDPAQDRVETVLRRRLDKASATIAIAGEQSCAAGTCTTIHIESPLAADAPDFLGLFGGLGGSASPAPRASVAPGAPGMTIDLLVDTATTRLDSIVMAQHGEQGDLTVTITIGAYDAPVTIEAPAPEDISDSPID